MIEHIHTGWEENGVEKLFHTIDFSGDDFQDHDEQKRDEPDPVKIMPIKTILFVDDEKPIRDLFKQALEKNGYKVEVAYNGKDAIRKYLRNPTDLIITDIFMPEKDGHSMMVELLREFPDAKIFVITGHKSFDSDLELDMAKGIGALKTFYKPVKFESIIRAIKQIGA